MWRQACALARGYVARAARKARPGSQEPHGGRVVSDVGKGRSFVEPDEGTGSRSRSHWNRKALAQLGFS